MTESYTAKELARSAGLPLRTVRYYVQIGLIEPPEGRGRGAHFRSRHLEQLRRVRLLQSAGFDLETIKARGVDLVPMLRNLHVDGLEGLAAFGFDLRDLLDRVAAKGIAWQPVEPASDLREQRIPMADGVDLVVRADVPLPSPKDLVDIALLIRRHFGGID